MSLSPGFLKHQVGIITALSNQRLSSYRDTGNEEMCVSASYNLHSITDTEGFTLTLAVHSFSKYFLTLTTKQAQFRALGI